MPGQDIEKLEEVLKDQLDGEIVEQTTSRLTELGENYCSVIFKVDVKVKNDSGEKVEYLVAKTATLNQEFLQQIFVKELDFYESIYNEIEKFAKKEGCEEFLNIFPKYFGGRKSLEDPSKVGDGSVLVLENLNVQGYSTVNRKTGFNLQQAKAIIETLATFHSLGLAMRHKERKKFEDQVLPYMSAFDPPKPENPDQDPHDLNSKATVKFLRESQRDPATIERFQRILEDQCPWGTGKKKREPWITFSHNDCWVNNVMLKEEKGEISVKLVDFQVISCSTPAGDLTFFLFTSVQDDVIRNNLDELIRYYYNCLINNLKRLEVPHLEKFSYDGFLNEIKTTLMEGELSHCMSFFVIVLQNKENVEDIANGPSGIEKMFSKEFSSEHKSRLLAVFDALVEREWI